MAVPQLARPVQKSDAQPGLVCGQECGPRFTLKLQSLQHGTFDSKKGEYEWVHKVGLGAGSRGHRMVGRASA